MNLRTLENLEESALFHPLELEVPEVLAQISDPRSQIFIY